MMGGWEMVDDEDDGLRRVMGTGVVLWENGDRYDRVMEMVGWWIDEEWNRVSIE